MSSFRLVETRLCASLDATVSMYEHAVTGARHVHLHNSDEERAFVIAFPTLPQSNDGRAHVLEHLLLCGSRRYPVRDPFFAMMSRSLATYMNALTYSDRTVYPFATTDRVDYQNLMEVYLDAVFFPRLDPLDFLQEAWRPVLEDGRLGLQGVVLNEMKGKYSDPSHAIYLGINRALLPGTTYAFDSGGDPLDIPQLTHADLVEFHAHHYHPSQAVFMSWGDVDPLEIQACIEARVLSSFDVKRPPVAAVPAESWTGMREATVDVPALGTSHQEHGMQLAWRLGDESDPDARMQARLLEAVLLAEGGGAVRAAVEAAGFGRLADHTGLDTSSTELVLHIGMAGLEESQLGAARECILQALQKVAQEGAPAASLQAGLRELRFQERRVTTGVQRLIGFAQAAVRRQNVLAMVDSEACLARLAHVLQEPGFVQRRVQALLADAPAVAAHIRPDAGFLVRRDADEAQFLAAWQARLSEAERHGIQQQGEALIAHQQAPQGDADKLLPRIKPSDVSTQSRVLLPLLPALWQDHAVTLPTNGISHALIKVDLSHADESDWPWLHLYAELLPQLGASGMDHLAAATWRRMRIAAMRVDLKAQETVTVGARLEFTLSVDALREEQAALPEVCAAWLLEPDLSDRDRLHYLINNHVRSRVAGLQEEAMQMASLEAQACVTGEGWVERAIQGLPSLAHVAELRQLLGQADGAGMSRIQQTLRRMHGMVLASPRVLLCAGVEQDAQALLEQLKVSPGTSFSPRRFDALIERQIAAEPAALGVFAPAQVNHCMAVWKTPALGHPDAAALAVLAELLQQQLLHPLLREQGGAYGANAGYQPDTGVFMCMTFSDPRLAATYRDIESSLKALQVQAFTPVALEEAILSVIKHLDQPMRGLQQLLVAWSLGRSGIEHAQRQRFRDGVLACTLDDVRRAARAHLQPSRTHRTAAIGWLGQDTAGLGVLDLMQRAGEVGLGH